MTDTRKTLVADGDHIERNDELCREQGLYRYTDFDAALLALRAYQADCDAPEPSNKHSRALGAEDRDHLLACALTTLAIWLPGFYEMGSEAARAVVAPVIHGWLEPWQPYTLGCLPKGAVFKAGAEDIDTYVYDPSVDAVKTYGCCDDDEVYVQGDPWEGKDRSEAPPPPVEEKTRLRRNITIVRHWFEDASLVETRMGSPLSAWIEQVEEEFNECGVDGPEAEGASVLDVSREMEVETHEDGNMTARFTAWLDFEYPDQGQSFDCDADVIQHIFYDEGGVAGEFRLLTHFAEVT